MTFSSTGFLSAVLVFGFFASFASFGSFLGAGNNFLDSFYFYFFFMAATSYSLLIDLDTFLSVLFFLIICDLEEALVISVTILAFPSLVICKVLFVLPG